MTGIRGSCSILLDITAQQLGSKRPYLLRVASGGGGGATGGIEKRLVLVDQKVAIWFPQWSLVAIDAKATGWDGGGPKGRGRQHVHTIPPAQAIICTASALWGNCVDKGSMGVPAGAPASAFRGACSRIKGTLTGPCTRASANLLPAGSTPLRLLQRH